MHKTTAWVLAAAASVAMGVFAYAGGAGADVPMSGAAGPGVCPTTPAQKVRAVLTFLHHANLEEIDLAKIADQKAQAKEVHAFAQRMQKDHADLDKALMAFAEKNKVDLTKEPAPADPIHAAFHKADDAMSNELKSMSGAAFDVAYASIQPFEHRFALEVIDQGLHAATRKDVQDLLNGARSVLSEHEAAAKQIQAQMQLGATR